MKKVTVINAYGDKNIGDAAILKVALDFIHQAYRYKCSISVLCEDTKSFSDFITRLPNITPYQLPYGYAIRGKKKISTVKKIARFFEIYSHTIVMVFSHTVFNYKPSPKSFYAYIKEIRNADIVVGMGGGYLTTNTTKDYFGLLLTMLPIYLAKWYKKEIIFLPMSFGPFANSHQEKIAFEGIKHTTVIARDQITLDILEKRGKHNYKKLFFAPDLALFLSSDKKSVKPKVPSNYIVLTAREWFQNKEKQEVYEQSLIQFIDYMWSRYTLKTVFIPMARNKIEDDDNRVAQRIKEQIKSKNTFSIFHPNSIEDVQKKLEGARAAICTRMHSAILSTTVQTPFIAIGYGHKTLGFVRNFNIEKWHIDIGDVTYESLIKVFADLMKKSSYKEFIRTINLQQMKNFSYKNTIINSLLIK